MSLEFNIEDINKNVNVLNLLLCFDPAGGIGTNVECDNNILCYDSKYAELQFKGDENYNCYKDPSNLYIFSEICKNLHTFLNLTEFTIELIYHFDDYRTEKCEWLKQLNECVKPESLKKFKLKSVIFEEDEIKEYVKEKKKLFTKFIKDIKFEFIPDII